MRKLMIGLLIPLVLISSVGRADAGVGAFLSWWNGQDMGDGVGFGAKTKFSLVPLVNVDGRLSYHTFGTPDIAVIPLELAASANVGLFNGGVGGGYYIFNGRDEDATNEWGGFLFIGADLTVAGIGVFGELKYTLVETSLDGRTRKADGFGVSVGASLGL